MKLWIRSQDRTMLDRAYDLCVDEDRIILLGRLCGRVTIAKYKSKERALEVLDEIQNILKPMIVFKNCNCTKDMLDKIKEVDACVVSDNSHIEQLSTCVYEMPKE